MAELIKTTDSLNDGRKKLNDAITDSNAAISTADTAKQTANLAKAESESTQTQLDTIVIEGDSSVEAAQARVNNSGTAFPTLKQRLDAENQEVTAQLQQNVNEMLTKAPHKEVDMSFSLVTSGKKNKKVIASFISDDGSNADYEKLLPIALAQNIPFGLGIVTDWVGKGGYMTYPQIREMEDAGCEIMGHTHNHLDLKTFTEEQLHEDLSTNLYTLRANGFNPTGLVYPFNSSDKLVEKVATNYFRFAFSKNGAFGQSQGVNFPKIYNYRIARVALGSYFDTEDPKFPSDRSSLEYYKSRVDEAVANDNWIVFVMHPWAVSHDSVQQQHLVDIIAYIKSLGIDIVSPSEGLERFGNTIEIGNPTERNRLYVGADGVIDNPRSGISVDGYNTRKPSDSQLTYEYDKVTITPINNTFALSQGFPTGKGGILYTYRWTTDYFTVKQEYHASSQLTTTGREEIYERFLDVNNEWTAWIKKNKLDFEKTTPTTVVPAHSTVNLAITELTGVKNGDVVHIEPKIGQNLPGGLMIMTYRTTTNQATVRFANVTSVDINLTDTDWIVTVIKK